MDQQLKVFVADASPKGIAAVYCNLANYSNTTTIDVSGEFFVASNQPVRITGGAGQVFYEWYDPWAKPRKFEGYVGTVNVFGSGVIAVWKCVRLENGTAGGVPPSMPFYTDPGAVPEVTDVEVTNFPDPQNVAGTVSVDSISGVVSVAGDVNITNSPLVTSGSVSGSVTSLNLKWDSVSSTSYTPYSPDAAAVVALPGYNTVTPTIDVGPSTVDTSSYTFNVTPTVLMLWDSTNNKWRAAQCNSSGALITGS